MGELKVGVNLEKVTRKIAALAEIEAALPVRLVADLAVEGERLKHEAAEKVLTEPSRNDRTYDGPGLRQRVSEGVDVAPFPGGIRITTSTPGRSEVVIPEGLEGVRGWRHPVFGKDVWVTQDVDANFSWFHDIMLGAEVPIVASVKRALDEAAEVVAHD